MVSAGTGSIDIFQDDWKACLRAHYFHLIHEQDWKNERSLATVLVQTGVSQEEVADWRREAMREIGIEEEGTEVAPVESTQAEVTQVAELPGDPPPEAVESVELAEAADVVNVTEMPEAVAEEQIAPEEAVEAAVDDTLNSETPHPEPPPKPKQMSLF